MTTKEKDIKTYVDENNKNEQENKWLEIFSLFIHDLESPLASMKYLLKIIEEGNFDYSKDLHKTLVDSSQVALKRAESILYDIMAIAKSGKVGIPVSLVTIVPDTLIQETIDMIKASAQERNITVTFTNNSGNTPVTADPKLLKRALDNLLYNAIRHTPSGGNIAVYTDLGKKNLYIHIKDSGSGLGDLEPELLFEKFGQIKLRAEGKHRGVGLGLYFCRLAATAMGGTIFASDHEKGGAVFTIGLLKGADLHG